MKRLLFLLAALFLVSCTSSPYSLTPQEVTQQKKKQTDPPNTFRPTGRTPSYPWHLINIWWEPTSTKTIALDSLTVPITIHRPIPEGVNLYLSPIGNARLNDTRLYAGLLTNATAWNTKTDTRLIKLGRAGIFSRWGNQPLPLNLANGGSRTHYESASYEGHFLTARRPYKWNTGTHYCTLKRGKTEIINGRLYTWAYYSINGTAIGQLAFPGQSLSLSPKIASFIEIYQSSDNLRSAIPIADFTVGRPIINGQTLPLKGAIVSTPRSGGTASPKAAQAQIRSKAVYVTLHPQNSPLKTAALPLR